MWQPPHAVAHTRCLLSLPPSPQATPVKAGRPSGIILSLPYLRVRAAQREAYKQGQVQPSWGSWLDVYLTVLAPLPTPVRGILGERRPQAARPQHQAQPALT